MLNLIYISKICNLQPYTVPGAQSALLNEKQGQPVASNISACSRRSDTEKTFGFDTKFMRDH